MIVDELRDRANVTDDKAAANLMREAAARIEVCLDAVTEGIGEPENPRRMHSALKRIHYALLVNPRRDLTKPVSVDPEYRLPGDE